MMNGTSQEKELDVVNVADDSSVFKRPGDSSTFDANSSKKSKMGFEEEGRPTREIASVMMTTSGFISPAREGKLPESKPPNLPPEFKPAPPPPPPAKPPSPFRSTKFPPIGNMEKKFEKKIKKKEKDKEKRKDRPPKPEGAIPLGPLQIVPPQQVVPQQLAERSSSQQPPNMMLPSPMIPHIRDNPQMVPQQHSPQMPGIPNMTQLIPGINDKLLQKKMMQLAKKQGMKFPKMPKIPKKHKMRENKMDGSFNPLMKPEKKKNPVGRPPKNPMGVGMPSKYMLAKQQAMQQQQQQQQHQQGGGISFGGSGDLQLPPFLPGGQNLLPNPMQFPPIAQNSSLTPPKFPPPPQNPPLIEGKLIAEPDRNKLNIFKKIQGKNKEDLSHKSLQPPALDFSSPQKFDRPELDIFRAGQQPGMPPQFDMMMKKKQKPPKPQVPEELPLNMSLSKPPDSHFSIDDLSIPKTPNFPRTPEMKMEKKKKRKEKEKKLKNEQFLGAMGGFFQDAAGPSNPFLPKNQENPAALLAGTGLTQAQQNLLFPFGNLSNLGNLMFPSGPGLIPNQGLIPPFPTLGAGPFGLNPPALGIPGSDLNLHKFSQKIPKKQEKKDFGNLLPDKSFCNVAPLVPPSLTIEPTPPKQQRFDLPLGAEKLPAATQITPIKSSFDAGKSQPTPGSSHRVESFVRQEESMTTYDLTSSPEPMIPPKPKTPPLAVTIIPTAVPAPPVHQVEPQLPPPPVSIPSSVLQQPMDVDIIKIKDKSEKKKDKEHKKEKKDKEGKIKKKKDKKDKSKNREGKEEKKEKKEKRDKESKEKKKEKKEKRREKEVSFAVDPLKVILILIM